MRRNKVHHKSVALSCRCDNVVKGKKICEVNVVLLPFNFLVLDSMLCVKNTRILFLLPFYT